jgi:hypothetical protein
MYSITVILLVIKRRRPRYPWSTGKEKTQRIENPLKVGNSDCKKFGEYELRRIR